MVAASRARRHLVSLVWLLLFISSVDAFFPRPKAAARPTTTRPQPAPKKKKSKVADLARTSGQVLATGCVAGVTCLLDDDLRRNLRSSWSLIQQGLRERARARAIRRDPSRRKAEEEYMAWRVLQRQKRRRRRRVQALKNAVVCAFWIGGLVALQVWQQIPTKGARVALEAAKVALDVMVPVLGKVLHVLGAASLVFLVFGFVVALVLLFPTLQMQGEAVRDDLRNSRSPFDPYSRTSRNFRRIAETSFD